MRLQRKNENKWISGLNHAAPSHLSEDHILKRSQSTIENKMELTNISQQI